MILVPLIIGNGFFTIFAFFEEYVAKEPLIRLDVFIEATLHGMIIWCILYYMPLYYEAIKGETPIIAVIVTPTTLGTGILYLLDLNTTTVPWVFLNLVSGLGMSLFFTATAFSIQAATMWIVMCALARVALLSSFLTKGFELDCALEMEQGFYEEK